MGLSQSVYSLRTAEKISFRWNEKALRTNVRNSRLRCSSSRPYCNAKCKPSSSSADTHTLMLRVIRCAGSAQTLSHLNVGRIKVVVALRRRHTNHELLGDETLAGVLHGELRIGCVVQRQERAPCWHETVPHTANG